MTYDPFDPFDQLLTETPAHLLASGHEWVQRQFYDELAAEVADLKQTSGELCDVCGWRFVVLDRCLNCEKG
jgi:hypothetical protein